MGLRQQFIPSTSLAFAETGEARPVSLSPSILISLYGVIPLSLMLVVVDICFFGGSLWRSLPFPPERLLWFGALFNLPHIVASIILILDSEYLMRFRKKLLVGSFCLTVLILAGPHLIGWNAFLMLAGIYTIYHVIGQQFGVTRTLLGRGNFPLFGLWKWTGVGTSTLIMLLNYGAQRGVVASLLSGFNLTKLFGRTSVFLVAALIVLTVGMIRRENPRRGNLYILANLFLILSCYGCYLFREPFFVMLMPRVVHDLTAFMFYSVHDINRNAGHSKNLIHRFVSRLSPWKLPIALLTPMVAIVVAFPLTRHYFEHDPIYVQIYLFMGALHYFTESFTWRGDSPYRRYVPLT